MSPDLIILGRDPEDSSRWLLECPDCGLIRSVAQPGKDAASKKSHSLCRSCAAMQPMPENTELLICFGQDLNSLRHWLFRCPDCGKVRSVTASQKRRIAHKGNSLCVSCAVHNGRSDYIKDVADQIIILKQFVTLRGTKNALARVQCPQCGKIFEKRRYHICQSQHTMCQSCAQPAGKHHHWWRGGTNRNQRGYHTRDWLDARRHILERDDCMCQFPGCIADSDLCIHHIIPYNETLDDNERNLITLCRSHHTWADSCLNESIPMFDAIISIIYNGI